MSLEGEYIGTAVLSGLWITPLSILWFISFCLARRRQDPARRGISWMKAVFPIWVLALVCLTIRGALVVWLSFDDTYYYSYVDHDTVNQVMAHLASAGIFFSNVADILLFITFVELASGFLLCLQNPAQPSSRRRVSLIAILAWGLVLFALSVAYFGLQNSYAVQYSLSSSQSSQYISQLRAARTMNQLMGALKVLLWLTSIPTLALAAYVVHKTKHHELIRGIAVVFLVATILDFVRLVVVMAIDVHVYTAGHFDVESAVTNIVEPFFDHVFMFVILVLLFSLSVRKQKGLWSQAYAGHSAWSYPTVAYMPTAQAGAPPMGMPMPMHGGEVKPGQQMPQPDPGLPAYLQVAQQQQWAQQQQQHQIQQQQGQQMAPAQGYYYYPQQTHQQPMPAYQQGQPQQPGAEPIRVAE